MREPILMLLADPLGYYAPYGSANNPGVGAVSWTQTGTFQNVTLSANVWDVYQGQPSLGTVNFYLTNQIGPGATLAANAVAHGTVAIPYSPTLVTLGSVATLGPGTYYLVIDSATPTSSWTYNYPGPATITADPSVKSMGDFSPRGGSVNTAFSPAPSFSQVNIPYDFSVTATNATPEPATVRGAGIARR